MEIAIRNYDGLIVRAHSVSVWRPAGIKLQRQTHLSTPHGSATLTNCWRSPQSRVARDGLSQMDQD